MTVTVKELGPSLTEAGRIARSNVEVTLRQRPGMWAILTNACLDAPTSDYHERLHLVVVGPPGVTVCEVRRGDRGFIDDTTEFLEVAALRASQKATRLGRVLKAASITATVQAVLSLHAPDISGAPSTAVGVPVVSSTQLGHHLARGNATLSAAQVARIVTAIRADHDRHDVAVNLGVAHGLVIEDATGAPFHVAYRARLANGQPVLVHLHDLTAGDRADLFRVAQRGFEVLNDLAPNPYIPPIIERLATYPTLDGDISWFAVGDDQYPTLADNKSDPGWNIVQRVRFASYAFKTLDALHHPADAGIEGLVLRDISPQTVRVALDNEPYFSRFRFARYVGRGTIAAIAGPQWEPDAYTAPEVRDGGLGAATAASDVYSLCAALIEILDVPRADGAAESPLAPLARDLLSRGCAAAEGDRLSAHGLALSLDSLFDDESGRTRPDDEPAPGPVYGYKEIRQLGVGGFGTTYLVRERPDPNDPFPAAEDESDCLVAKLPHDSDRASRTIRGHRLARPYADRPASLATVLHVAGDEWVPGRAAALIAYVRGWPIKDAAGALRTGPRTVGDAALVTTCLRWYLESLKGLACLHPRLVHGDISPDNVLVADGAIVLVDYDTVTPPGNVYRGERMDYASHQRRQGARASCTEDVFACASTIFDCLVGGGRPFMRLGRDNPREGLAWPSRLPYGSLPAFQVLKACLDRATAPDEGDRYRDAPEALDDLSARLGDARVVLEPAGSPDAEAMPAAPGAGRAAWPPTGPGDASDHDHQGESRPGGERNADDDDALATEGDLFEGYFDRLLASLDEGDQATAGDVPEDGRAGTGRTGT